MRRPPVGFRIRSERRARGLTQAELAKRTGISPSYLNLIEANKREIGGALLQRIAAVLEVETDALTGRLESRMIEDLREVALEPLLQTIGLSPDRATDLVMNHPDWSRALLTLYRAWRDQVAIANALANRFSQDSAYGDAVHQLLSHVTAIRSSAEILGDVPELDHDHRQRFREIISMESLRLSETAPLLASLFDQSGSVYRAATPADEVDDFMLQHNAWFPDLEDAGDRIRERMVRDGGTDEPSAAEYLRSRHATVVSGPVTQDGPPAGFRNFMRFDPERNEVQFLAHAPESTRRFQLARQIASLEAAAEIEAQLEDPVLTSDVARGRARYALSSYVAGVMILPYGEFLRSATDVRYDIDILSQRYDASYEQICHRLITLRDPDRPGVPFAFLRADPAGFIAKRFPLPDLPLLRNGHACPLWVMFSSYQTPSRTVCRLVEFPNGARYLMIAQAVTKRPASFHEAPFLQSVMLICGVSHAGRTVYADGLDLHSAQVAIKVGPGCRLCPRADCRFRNESQIVDAALPPR